MIKISFTVVRWISTLPKCIEVFRQKTFMQVLNVDRRISGKLWSAIIYADETGQINFFLSSSVSSSHYQRKWNHRRNYKTSPSISLSPVSDPEWPTIGMHTGKVSAKFSPPKSNGERGKPWARAKQWKLKHEMEGRGADRSSVLAGGEIKRILRSRNTTTEETSLCPYSSLFSWKGPRSQDEVFPHRCGP